MADRRPERVGDYQVLQDFENSSMSIRVLKMADDAQQIVPHLHHRSTQIYVALSGRAVVECDGVEYAIEPFEVVPVPLRSLHTARAVDGPAVVMNISVPPLRADDQSPTLKEVETPDMRLPQGDGDVDD